MAHHKRRKPRNQRAGCWLCKPHKKNAHKDSTEHQTMQERRALFMDRLANAPYDDEPYTEAVVAF